MLNVEWIDGNREPQNPPDPDYPEGIDVDATEGATPTCTTLLPYPAKRCGHFLVTCSVCKQRVAVTTAGRPDDPRSLKIKCGLDTMSAKLGPTGEFPEGKLGANDEGALRIGIGIHPSGKTVVIDFGKSIAWVGMPKQNAILFAETILEHAKKLED